MPIFFVLIIVAAIAAAIGFAVWNSRMKDKRRKDLAGWAQANGLKFLPEKDHSVWMRYQLFKCLQRGEDRYAYNVMLGTAGQRVTCCRRTRRQRAGRGPGQSRRLRRLPSARSNPLRRV